MSEIEKFDKLTVEPQKGLKLQSYEEAKKLINQSAWQRLESIRVEDALLAWLETLSEKTKINYVSAFRKLSLLRLIDEHMSLQAFSLVNHDAIIDRIKLVDEWSECTRQARAAAYISFTRFLERRSDGIIQKAKPNREGNAKTFYRVREKVKTNAMNQSQWTRFLAELELLSYRESLIAKATLQGGKRIGEVLELQTDQIDWERNKIHFNQSKTKGVEKVTVITYPDSFIKQLFDYIGERVGLVFVTRNGKKIDLKQIASIFAKAGKLAGIPFKVTPHVLRASTVTFLKFQGFSDSDILRVTGHSSAEMIHAYDKRSNEHNATEKVNLIK